jgi:Cof subfamily protein (haloacid dehalogenase superfamily)
MHGISLVVSDVDGTLVTSDKVLTRRSCEAVTALRQRGIGFTVVSSRPPFGMRMLIGPLGLTLPLAAFNGGTLVTPDLKPVEQRLLGEATAGAIVDLLRANCIDVWLFTGEAWLLIDPNGTYVPLERHTVETEPTVVKSFDGHLADAAKIVGVSADFARLQSVEAKARSTFADRATVLRSQRYYLDVTPHGTDKGTAVCGLAERLGVGLEEIAVIGDMENDVPMFQKGGFSVAMGNATDKVKSAAQAETSSNDEDGFADAVERLILPRARAPQRPAGS